MSSEEIEQQGTSGDQNCFDEHEDGSMAADGQFTSGFLCPDVLSEVFCFLPLRDALRLVPRVCREWWGLINENNELWSGKIVELFGFPTRETVFEAVDKALCEYGYGGEAAALYFSLRSLSLSLDRYELCKNLGLGLVTTVSWTAPAGAPTGWEMYPCRGLLHCDTMVFGSVIPNVAPEYHRVPGEPTPPMGPTGITVTGTVDELSKLVAKTLRFPDPFGWKGTQPPSQFNEAPNPAFELRWLPLLQHCQQRLDSELVTSEHVEKVFYQTNCLQQQLSTLSLPLGEELRIPAAKWNARTETNLLFTGLKPRQLMTEKDKKMFLFLMIGNLLLCDHLVELPKRSSGTNINVTLLDLIPLVLDIVAIRCLIRYTALFPSRGTVEATL